MTCQEFLAIRRDYTRRQWLSEAGFRDAKLHLAECPACREWAASESALTTALADLSRQSTAAAAPPQVESAVMAAFARHKQARRHAIWRKAAWAVPLAAGLLLFALLRPKQPAPQIAREIAPAPAPAVAPENPARVAAAEPRRATRPVVRNTEYVTDFVPLRFGKPLESGEPVMVVRMELQGSQLRKLGLPVAPDDASGTVKADVLLGGDGLAKAIRFVY